MPKTVAIITRTRDRLPLLARAVESVLGQDYLDWEHVNVNDGGDPTALDTFLEPYRERYGDRLNVLHLRQNVGMQNAANHGIRESSSTFLIIHDDDDSWEKGFLESCVQHLSKAGEKSPVQGVITQTTKVLEKYEEGNGMVELERKLYLPLEEISFFRIGYENPFPPIAFLYRRKVHDEIGFFNQRWEEAGDFDFNIRFLQRYEIEVIPKPLANYHFREETSGNLANSQIRRTRESHLRVVELKNHYLRGESPEIPPTTALALQIAYFLVENQWKTAANYEAVRRIDQAIHVLQGELCGDTYRDRFTTLREGSAKTLDHLNSLLAQHEDLRDKISDTRGDLANKLEGLLNANRETTESAAHLNELLTEQLLPAVTTLHRDLAEKTTDTHQDLANKLNAVLSFHETQNPRLAALESELGTLRTSWEQERQRKIILRIGPLEFAFSRRGKSKK